MKTDRRPGAGWRGSLARGARFGPFGATLLAVLLGAAPAAAQFFAPPGVGDSERSNVFILPDRELRQLIAGAKEAIAQELYGDAVDALNRLLVDPELEDYFLGGSDDATQLSLKAEAHRLLGALPPAGREAYEQKFGHQARRMLDEAIQQANPQQLSQVARLYFHTQAGMEAAMLLGRYHLNRGRPLAGALWLKRLMEASQQAAQYGRAGAAFDPGAKYDPELSILLAQAWLEAGLADSAQQTLLDLKRRTPQAQIRVGDQTAPLFAQDDRALEWLENLIAARREGGSLRQMDWTLYRGNPARNAQTAGGFPLPEFVWKAPTSNEPSDLGLIAHIEKSELRGAAVPALPAGQPLAVGDVVVMRTPEQVVGVDFRQGKRIWLFPPPNSIFDRTLETEDALPPNQAEDQQRRELKQRIWEDAPYGQLSSDGDAVYFVHDLGYALEGMHQMLIGARGVPVPNRNYPKTYNQLVALDLRSEGKLRWIVGGENGENEPRLAGAFFLGPPLPLSGQLYVLAEVNAEIRLVVLDAATGQLQWAQQLAHVDPASETILHDVIRRLAGATPSFADGVLVCPTSAGAVVAVDIAARSLLWGYQYQRNNLEPQYAGSIFAQPPPRELGKRWADGLAVIADGRVLVTPVESDYLHCLDLLTGKMLWQQPRGESLFVAGVHNGRAIVVGKTQLIAYDLASGRMEWERPVGLPTGRGFITGGSYFHPVYHPTNGGRNQEDEPNARFELVRFDLQRGEVADRVETDGPLGNLICHQDQIVSQGAQWVGAMYQVEPLRELVAARLAKNPDDAWAVARQAQLLRHEGKDEEALAALRRAHALDPEDESTRQLLIDAMLEFLAEDFAAHRDFAQEIQRLDPAAHQRSEFLRLLIAGYQQTGEAEKAFEACLKLAGLDTVEGIGAAQPAEDQIGPNLTVRRDRWINGRVKDLLAAADETQRAAIDAAIAARLEETLQADAPSALSRFVNYFGSHPLADRARLRLAEKLLESSSLLEAELLLVRLEDAADPAIAAPANLHLARLMERAQRWSAAARYYRRLEERWPNVELENGQTAAELVAALPGEGLLAQALRGAHAWPSGRVEVKMIEERLGNVAYQKVYPVELTETRGALLPGARAALDQAQSQVVVRDAEGRTVATLIAPNLLQNTRYMTPVRASGAGAFHERSVYHGKLNGHLLLVSLGSQVAAFNLLEGALAGEALLWHKDVEHAVDLRTVRRGRGASQLSLHNPWGDAVFFAVGADGKPIGQTGPLNEHGVCYQRRSELVCVHPVTGEEIWTREEIEPGSEVFGDDEYLFVIPYSGAQSRQAMVLNALDGSLIGYREVPARANRWAAFGRRLLSYRQEGRQAMRVYMQDLLGPSEQDWERSFALESKGCLVEGDKLAVLEPSGKFTLLALEDGRPLIETQLEPEKSLEAIYVLPSPEQYLLFTRTTHRESSETVYQPPSIPDAPLVNGRVYAFDRTTGQPQWPSPAYVEQWGLPLDQPTGTPVVVLMRRAMETTGRRGRRNALAVMCLDRRDGSLLFHKDDLAVNAGTANDRYTLEADPARNAVNLVFPTHGVSLTFTDEPEPPQPPVDTNMLGAAGTPAPDPRLNAALVPAGADPFAPMPADDPFGQPRAGAAALPPPPVQAAPRGLPPNVHIHVGGRLIPVVPGQKAQPRNP